MRRFSQSETQHIVRALGCLERDDPHGFRWTLWIGLGDDWCPFQQRLIEHRAIKVEQARGDGLTITERGTQLRARLEQELQTGGGRRQLGEGGRLAQERVA